MFLVLGSDIHIGLTLQEPFAYNLANTSIWVLNRTFK